MAARLDGRVSRTTAQSSAHGLAAVLRPEILRCFLSLRRPNEALPKYSAPWPIISSGDRSHSGEHLKPAAPRWFGVRKGVLDRAMQSGVGRRAFARRAISANAGVRHHRRRTRSYLE